MANYEYDHALKSLAERNVIIEKSRWEAYELGIIKNRTDETKKTKTVNLSQVSDKKNFEKGIHKRELSEGEKIAKEDKILSLIDKEKALKQVVDRKKQVNHDL